MAEAGKEKTSISKNAPQLEWPARFFFALISAPTIGVAIGFLTAIGISGVDGEGGYAALYNGVIFTGLAFLGLLFVGR